MQQLTSSKALPLFIILLLSLSTRLPFLGANDIAIDEPASIFFAQMPVGKIVSHLSQGNNPPLYEIILHFWIETGGIDSIWVRLLSVIFSAFTAIGIWLVGRRYFSVEAAWLAALLYIFSTINIFYAQTARAYALLSMLTVFSSLFYIRLREEPGNRKVFLGYLISTVLMIYSHYTGIALLAVQVICLLFMRHKKKDLIKAFALNYLLVFVLYLPNIYVFITNFLQFSKGTWVEAPTAAALYDNLMKFSNKPVVAVVCILILIGGIIKLILKKRHGESTSFTTIYVLSWFLLPYLGFYLFSFISPIFLDRYLLFLSIPFYLIIACFAVMLFKKYRMVAVFIMVILFVATTSFRPSNQRELEITVEKIREHHLVNQASLVLLVPEWLDKGVMYYYDRSIFSNPDNFKEKMHGDHIYGVNSLEEVKKLEPGKYSRIILVQSGAEVVDPQNRIFNYMQESFVKEKVFKDIKGYKISIFASTR